jgi:hypothetical protein
MLSKECIHIPLIRMGEMSPAQPSKKEQRPRSRPQERRQQRKRQPRLPLLAKIREPPITPISVKVRQLPRGAPAIHRDILQSKPRGPRGILHTHVHVRREEWQDVKSGESAKAPD